MKSNTRVLFLAAEADPFVKVGGLGDVAGSLPLALKDACELDVRLVIPFHGAIQRKAFPFKRIASFEVPKPGKPIRAEAFQVDLHGLPVYLIGGAPIPPKAPVYTSDPSVDGYKFTFFSLAALELVRRLDWAPDLVHANDWHTAMAIYALSLRRDQDEFFQDTATLMGVHNLPYLGIGAGVALNAFGLPPAYGSALPWWAQDAPFALGLLAADHIVAASPTYAAEILTTEFGAGLESFLKTRSETITGILNGINQEKWDPRNDNALTVRYSADNLAARMENKIALLQELDLNPDPKIPLLAMITRMDPQKGIDLVPKTLRKIARQRWNAILLGTGVPEIEDAVRKLETEFPARLRAAIRFDAMLSRRIYAGADVLMIPSRYEPCGLTQMIAMRYGCVPLGRATGGLKDTIQDSLPGQPGTGFLFERPHPVDFAKALRRALRIYPNREEWRTIQLNGMRQDFSWDRSARQYADLYQSVINRRKGFAPLPRKDEP